MTCYLTTSVGISSIETMAMDINKEIAGFIVVTFEATFSELRPPFIFINPFSPINRIIEMPIF